MKIYKITNKINGKIYIGQTIRSIQARWNDHCKRSSNYPLSRAIKKYGKDNFIVEEIDTADSIDELNVKESYWIYYYKSYNSKFGYNLEFGGNKNKKVTKKTRNKISKLHKGKKISEETKKKMSESARLRGNCRKTLEVEQYDFEGNLIKIFSSFKQASQETGIPNSTIRRSCLKVRENKSRNNPYNWKIKEQ